MSPELPGERLQRRLGLLPEPGRSADAAEPDDEADPNSLLPRWLPDGAAEAGWLAKVRADPGRAGAIALAVIAALAVLITVFTMLRDRPAPVLSAKLPPVEMVSTSSPRTDEPAAGPEASQLVVSVVGLVHKPGLATLAPGSRIADALTAAGGALDGADTVGLNLARPLVDGEQIVVGLAPPPGRSVLGSSVGPGSPPPEGPRTSTAPTAVGPEPKPGGSARLDGGEAKLGPSQRPGEPVNLNTATVEQLDALPGVGPVTAAAIVAWRTAHGKFANVDQLGDVDGIGPARLDKLRAMVRV
ncbi:ComEA family DNA-binding protein [[Mycobacterium] nativiensis]|uniref:ComEA family DNA-binding protein n=1 Tax=[Mycobacterium] nativiensis TaxID=2855503 RepID=A0ABU5Y272_9MYCO|nr:ComEA family DNA-binding protein [Mycolicibacter sp. MYC340]MEB3034314.1 ComEA family DNA-binding protein [Mycolicibacter sp. MYC340]